MKYNKHIIVIVSDKGNMTVIVDKHEYDENMFALFND